MRAYIIPILWRSFFLSALVLTGCYEVHHGLYDAKAMAAGWNTSQSEGITYFARPLPKKPNWFISTCSKQKGELYFYLGSTAWDPMPFSRSVTFLGDTVRVVFHDKNDRQEVLSAKHLSSFHNQTLQVGDSEDFTVVLPTFKIGDDEIRELSARFTWSNRKYRQWIPLQ